jgi:hypothetical protein
MIKKVESCKSFPTNVTPLCDWCVYKGMCPAWKHMLEVEQKTITQFSDDDGVKLVDAFAVLSDEKAHIEKDLDALRERLMEFAKPKGIDVVRGTEKKALVRAFVHRSFPPQADREHLNELIRKAGWWDELSNLDLDKLEKALDDGTLPKELQEDIEEHTHIKEGHRMSLSRLKDDARD